MSTPLLDRAARALRERTAAEPGGGEETLGRVVSVIRQRARRRRVLTVLVLQLAIGGVGLGAWAAASGRLESLLATWRPAPPPAERPRPVQRRRAHAPAPSPAPLPPPATAPRPSAPARPPARRTAAVAPAPSPIVDDEDALYQQAHQAHFVRRDFAGAVAAWNRYLALERPGRFLLEARYNRAIALYRLGRAEEAARALQPFARGEYGPYRQQQAQALLQRLGRPPP